jgi:hypothetical protein
MVLALGAAVGCSSSSDAPADDGPGAGDGPVYVTTLQLASPAEDGGPTYLVTADSIEAGNEWNPSSGDRGLSAQRDRPRRGRDQPRLRGGG